MNYIVFTYIFNIYVYIYMYLHPILHRNCIFYLNMCSFFVGTSDYLLFFQSRSGLILPTHHTFLRRQGERREDKKGLGNEKRKSEELCHRRHSCHTVDGQNPANHLGWLKPYK